MTSSSEPLNAPARGRIRPRGPRGRRPAGSWSIWDVLCFPGRLVMRLFFPRLVDRYVMGELLGPLAFGWSLFIILMVFTLNLVKAGQVLARGADSGDVMEMLGLHVVLSSVMCMPMAMLLSGLLTFGRLSADNELVATQAAGIPNLRLIGNALLLGILVSFAGLAINETWIPAAGQRLKVVEARIKKQVGQRVLEELAQQKLFTEQEFEGGKLVRVIMAQKFTAPNPPYPAVMRDVTYIEYDEEKPRIIVSAPRAEYAGPSETKPGQKQLHRWVFYEPEYQVFTPQVSSRRNLWGRSEDTELEMFKSPVVRTAASVEPTEQSYRDLKATIAQMRADGVRKRRLRPLEVECERKLAIPFAAVVLALVGSSLGIRRQRTSAPVVGVGLSLLIILVYYIGISFFGVLGEGGKLPPIQAAWACNVIGLFLGLGLAWRSTRQV